MNLNKLLQEKPESYYWAGFLMADGCFSKKEIGKVVELLKQGKRNSDIMNILELKNKVNRNYVSKIKCRYMIGV